jgi:hypothetical protein
MHKRLEHLEHLIHDVLLPAHQTLSLSAGRVVIACEPETLWHE